MATFLFLVSVTASTLLLLAIAAEEVRSATRRLFARWIAARKAVDLESLKYHEHPARSGERLARPAKAQANRVAPQGKLVSEEEGWVPDRAA